jgi:FkbM family methyltransferase
MTVEGLPVLRRRVSLFSPFRVDSIPFLSRVHRAAYRAGRRWTKTPIGKPAKLLFRIMMAAGARGEGRFSVDLPGGRRQASFNARNTQFGALYQDHFKPIYEPETSALLDLLVADEGCFLDIGANWGWYSVLIAGRPGFRGQIHAFEPFPPTYADLERVVRQLGLGDRIFCHETALGNSDGQASMTIPGAVQSGYARLSDNDGVPIRLARLDSLDLPPPDVIKIDAEDHEIGILRGGEQTIMRARPFVVFENWSHTGQAATALEPLHWFAARDHVFYHAGWSTDLPDQVVPELPPLRDGRAELVLLPTVAAERFYLP